MQLTNSHHFSGLDTAFRRAAGPLVLGLSALFTGCTTIKSNETAHDLLLCTVTVSSTTSTGIQDILKKIDLDGVLVDVKIPGLNYKSSKSQAYSLGPACRESERVVTVGMTRDHRGEHSLPALGLMYAVAVDPKTDPDLRSLISLRLAAEHGVTLEDIPKISKAQAALEAERNKPPPEPERFRCTMAPGGTGPRICQEIGDAPALQ